MSVKVKGEEFFILVSDNSQVDAANPLPWGSLTTPHPNSCFYSPDISLLAPAHTHSSPG